MDSCVTNRGKKSVMRPEARSGRPLSDPSPHGCSLRPPTPMQVRYAQCPSLSNKPSFISTLRSLRLAASQPRPRDGSQLLILRALLALQITSSVVYYLVSTTRIDQAGVVAHNAPTVARMFPNDQPSPATSGATSRTYNNRGGRPKEWTTPRARRLTRLYCYTALKVDDILKVLDDGVWSPG